ncbi:MAG TPA: hypothetical protein ENK44_03665 [Caldithrix abyssi]|uniref:Uncharacterized protein n=1 Tax=Caldithrix abyssi TaxID=187145 RepID=A0A7V4TYM5_CALAY|nr:hypothetical protein [Caldithrix abyssi]
MKELSLLNNQDQKSLRETIEQACGILLPEDSGKFGTLSFHLFAHSGQKSINEEIDTYFQIRWGMHSIYKSKHFTFKKDADIVSALQKRIHQARETIRKEFHRYCEDQLRSIVSLELEPKMQRRFPGSHTFNLGLCHGRKPGKQVNNFGWPYYCIFISWYDELDEFQEFLYPVKFDAEQRTFIIPVEDVLQKFHQFRDTVF